MRRLRGWACRTRTRKRHFGRAVEMLGKFSLDHPNILGLETFRARAATRFFEMTFAGSSPLSPATESVSGNPECGSQDLRISGMAAGGWCCEIVWGANRRRRRGAERAEFPRSRAHSYFVSQGLTVSRIGLIIRLLESLRSRPALTGCCSESQEWAAGLASGGSLANHHLSRESDLLLIPVNN
jgi:hypothetical protein